ncbi:hypothetical protein AB6N24_13560 [Cellulomonas sp. 179-A 4D5 NHS]|uniref:hypothetical protein n=1 Tax=Cellulomonas sp. 179-A 4D5 NHS TaxID=3142378 RepID=UPI0039A0F3AD
MPPRSRGALAALLALSVAVCGFVLPAAAAPGSAGDVLSVSSRRGIHFPGRLLVSSPELFDATPGDVGRDTLTIEVRAAEGGSPVTLVVAAPLDSPRLVVGPRSTRAAATSQTPGLQLSGWCDETGDGTMDVLDVEHDADGRLSGLALDYELTCTGATPILGTLRWSSDVPYRETVSARLPYHVAPVGRTARGTATLTNAGTAPQSYGVTTADVRPLPLVIDRDGCAGATLAPGETCTVDFSAVVTSTSYYSAHLHTPDESVVGSVSTYVVMLPEDSWPKATLTARPERLAVTLSAGPGDGGTFRVLRAAGDGPEVTVADDVTLPWTDTAVNADTVYTYRVRSTQNGGAFQASEPVTARPFPAPQGSEGAYVAVAPERVMDTRNGTGVRAGTVGPGETVTFDPAAAGAVPRTGVRAVLLNVTGTLPTALTNVRVWASGTPIPGTSSLNMRTGETRANQVVVPVGADGRVSLNNAVGRTHLIADVQGYYSTASGPGGGGYHPQDQARALDTRLQGGALDSLEEVWVPLSGVPEGAEAVDVNLTVTMPTGVGHLVAWSGEGAAPNASHVNFVPGQTIPNHAVVPVSLGEDGAPGIVVRNNSGGRTHVIVDVQGWYDDGSLPDGMRFYPQTPTRLMDTRRAGPVKSDGETLRLSRDVLPAGVVQVVNVTVTDALGVGHVIAWSGDGTVPTTSTGNYAPGETAPSMATVTAAPAGGIALTVRGATAHLIVDSIGVFY